MGSILSSQDIATTSRLRWRCRRGMRELDTLLERWLAERWPGADVSDRASFERLLGCEDDELWDWCLGRSIPDDPELAAIVKQVAGTAADRERGGLGG